MKKKRKKMVKIWRRKEKEEVFEILPSPLREESLWRTLGDGKGRRFPTV